MIEGGEIKEALEYMIEFLETRYYALKIHKEYGANTVTSKN
jgi:hypothetical protein